MFKKEEKKTPKPSSKKETPETRKNDSETGNTLAKKSKKKETISLIILLSVSILVGAGGGFLFYRWQNPQSASLTGQGSEGYIPTKKEIDDALKKGSILDDYKDKAYQIVNYSLSIQSKSSYALTIGKASVTSSGITQKVVSSTYVTPQVIYNQNVSSSSLVKTANRFYDYSDGSVHCYLQNVPDDWKNGNENQTYTYDEYMQKYGKLLQPSYYCTATTDSSELTEARPISDRFLSLDEADYEKSSDKTKHHVNGVLIYLIGPKTVKKSVFEKRDSSYFVSLDLFTDQDRKENKEALPGNSYYSVQMRATGGLSSRPVFSSSHLEFTLDESLNLVSTYFYDEYTAVVGPINSPAKSEMYQYYFRSDSNVIQGIQVDVPEYNQQDDFRGYELFPKEG